MHEAETSLNLDKIRRDCARALDGLDWDVLGKIASFRLSRALRREIAPDHVLAGRKIRAIARQNGTDHVLFLLEDGRLAGVYLTWSKQQLPGWPATYFFDDPEDFASSVRTELAYEAAIKRSFEIGSTQPEGTFLCPVCRADWGEAEFSEDCSLCGGGALAIPCPICGGACGAIWSRAVIDSIGSGEAIWVGCCAHDDGRKPSPRG